MRNRLALLLLSLGATFSMAHAGDNSELKKTLLSISEANRTTAQQLVVDVIQKFNSALSDLGCEPNLQPGSDKSRLQVVLDELPPWLEHLAEKAFLDRVTFDPRTVALLKTFQFNTDLQIQVRASSSDADKVADLVRRQWLDVPPTEDPASHGAIKATVSNLRTLDGAASFAMDVLFANGQRLALKFSRIELGRETAAPAVARLVIAAINHREGLATEDRLRQEMNAFRYDLGKLLRVTTPESQRKVEELRTALVDAQPKPSLLSTFARNIGIGKKADERLGNAFAAYMKVREKVVVLAQAARNERLDESVPAADEKDQVQIVQRLRPSIAPGRLATAYVSPRPSIPTAATPSSKRLRDRIFRRTEPVDDSTYFFNTYVWMTDPSFMMTHPLYWGARDGSFMSYMMYYDWMASEQHRRDHVFENQTAPPVANMNQFDQPVDPVYTTNPATPFVDPWTNADLPSADTITPKTSADGTVSWVDQSGQPADFFYVPQGDVDRAWDKVTGEDKALTGEDISTASRSTTTTTTTTLTPDEQSRWDNGGSTPPTPTADPNSDATGY